MRRPKSASCRSLLRRATSGATTLPPPVMPRLPEHGLRRAEHGAGLVDRPAYLRDGGGQDDDRADRLGDAAHEHGGGADVGDPLEPSALDNVVLALTLLR